jgi:hypothetical protein
MRAAGCPPAIGFFRQVSDVLDGFGLFAASLGGADRPTAASENLLTKFFEHFLSANQNRL